MLITPAPTSSVINHLKRHLTSADLTFLTYLPPSSVPFYLACGPSLAVTTTSPSTTSYFNHFFLSQLTDDAPTQSPLALLLGVSSPRIPSQADWGITELLIYATLAPPATSTLTPPPSSPAPQLKPTLSIHALPLSSRHNFPTPGPASETALFTAPNPQDTLNPVISSAAKKRRIDTLDKAVEKKTKRAKTAQPLTTTIANPGGISPTPESRRRSGGVSTALTKPAPGNTLARSSTALAKPPPLQRAKSRVAEQPDKSKDLITRIVLDEMKRHGLGTYPARAKSLAPGPITVEDDAREEYKNVFHHAVKAAQFALRNDDVLVFGGGKRVREVVRTLVDVFTGGKGHDDVEVEVEGEVVGLKAMEGAIKVEEEERNGVIGLKALEGAIKAEDVDAPLRIESAPVVTAVEEHGLPSPNDDELQFVSALPGVEL